MKIKSAMDVLTSVHDGPLFLTSSHLKTCGLKRRKDQLSLIMCKVELRISIQLPSFIGNEQTALLADPS